MRHRAADRRCVTGTARSVFGVAAGKRAEHDRERARDRGVSPSPSPSVKSEIPFVPGALFRKLRARRWPEPRQVPRKLDPPHVERAVERHAGARARRVRRRREDAVANEDAARAAVARREVVAVDADRRRLRGQPPLHRGDGLAPGRRIRSRAPARGGTGRPGAGRVTTWIATGPCGVNCTLRSYVDAREQRDRLSLGRCRRRALRRRRRARRRGRGGGARPREGSRASSNPKCRFAASYRIRTAAPGDCPVSSRP